MTTRPALRATLLVAAGLSLAAPVTAVENEWRAGAGLGVAGFLEDRTDPGPLGGAHLGYGLTDVLDLRLELLGSSHGTVGERRVSLFSATTGVSARLEVIEWVPWVGIQGGVYGFFGGLEPTGLARTQVGASLDAGVDYTLTRTLGAGVEVRYHALLGDPPSSIGDAPLLTVLLHLELRWGW